MAKLIINHALVTAQTAQALMDCCPFGAILYEGGRLSITAGCRMCRLCVKNGPQGLVEYSEDDTPALDYDAWRGIAVYVEHVAGEIHPVTYELIGKALELARVTGHPVHALFIGHNIAQAAQALLEYGVDAVYLYDDPALAHFNILPYAAAFEDYVAKVKPSAVLVGATNAGRALAPRIAARFRTGLTADCTVLEMKENTDLVQIRPAFGGNIMAQIVTPRTRPQLCTVRYKIFSPPPRVAPHGQIIPMRADPLKVLIGSQILDIAPKPKEIDLSDAEIVVAVGRGLKAKTHLEMVEALCTRLGAQMACTRPLIENGWFDPRRQIGLSGRTVKPKLILTLGISGSVQFAAGMRAAEYIIAINDDPHAPIFDIAHYGFVGDLYEIVPRLLELAGEGQAIGCAQ